MLKRARWPEPLSDKVMLVVLLIYLLLLLLGCASRQASLTKTHRHYEKVMGLEPTNVAFGKLEGRCACVVLFLQWDDTWVFYNTSSRACRLAYSVKQLVLHELCHLRYQHLLLVGMSKEGKHKEVDSCVREYWRK